jgi:hypothetical protein
MYGCIPTPFSILFRLLSYFYLHSLFNNYYLQCFDGVNLRHQLAVENAGSFVRYLLDSALCHSISYVVAYRTITYYTTCYFPYSFYFLYSCLLSYHIPLIHSISSPHPLIPPSLPLFHSHGCRLVCELCLSYGEITKISDDVAAEHLSLAGFSRYMKSRK